jgi:hypothetical protein
LENLLLPVIYKSSHFCSSNWGSCGLTLKELACSFNLPSPSHSLVDCHALLSLLFLLKLLEAPLQHVLTMVSACSGDTSPMDPSPPLLVSDVCPEYLGKTWLPLLGKCLPDAWCDEYLILDKVAKVDDSLVPSHLWDN